MFTSNDIRSSVSSHVKDNNLCSWSPSVFLWNTEMKQQTCNFFFYLYTALILLKAINIPNIFLPPPIFRTIVSELG